MKSKMKANSICRRLALSWAVLFVPLTFAVELPSPQSVLVAADDLTGSPLLASPERAETSGIDPPPQWPAQRVRVKEGRREFWDVQILLPNRQPVKKGDVLYVTFRFRTVTLRDESGEGSLSVYFQQKDSPWEKSVVKSAEAGPEWKEFAFAFRSGQDFAVGEARLGFGFGEREETVDLADVRLVNYGTALLPESLPQTRATYAGRELDASWRKAADDRIEQIRKAKITLVVKDGDGQPVKHAKVKLLQKKHAFWFGSAVAIRMINDPSPEGDRYRQTVTSLFNHVVVENALKWPAWAGEWDMTGQNTLAHALGWIKGEGLHLKGHVLVWPSFRNMPKSIAPLRDRPDELRAAVANRVTKAATESTNGTC